MIISKRLTHNPIFHSLIWTVFTALFAFVGEYFAHLIFRGIKYMIVDSQTLNKIVASPDDLIRESKLYHYTIIIMSALTVEYLIYVLQNAGSSKSPKEFWLSITSILVLFVIFFVTFFFQASHHVHETIHESCCGCFKKSSFILTTSLIITFLIRYGIIKNEQNSAPKNESY